MTQELGLGQVYSLWENDYGKARKGDIPREKEKQMQPSPALLCCLAASQPFRWYWGGTEKAGKAGLPLYSSYNASLGWCYIFNLVTLGNCPKLCGLDPYQRGWLMSPGARQNR